MPVIPGGSLTFRQLSGRSAADPLAAGGAAGCSVRVVRIPPGARTPHRHPGTSEIVYVAEGSGTAWEDGTRTPVTAGDLITIAPGVPHATASTTPLTLICFFPTLTLVTEELPVPLLNP